jgi:hypothetical protein
MKYWEIIADNLSKAVGVGVAFQPWIPMGAQSGLRTHIATTESIRCACQQKAGGVSRT